MDLVLNWQRQSMLSIKKRTKPYQFTLPIDPTARQLQQVSIDGGDRTIYSVEELMSGTEEFYSLNFGMIKLPSPFITLLH